MERRISPARSVPCSGTASAWASVSIDAATSSSVEGVERDHPRADRAG
jgi:hypothetical protein